MRQILHERFAIPESRIQTLIDEQATHRRIRAAFAELSERVQPGDFVYIHYSGHGSFVPDANGDEWRSGQDQTWVGYGARAAESVDLDRFDILDDEINQWLTPIAERAGELIYVSDSCHSASNTRGNRAPVTRAALPDPARHPLADVEFSSSGLDRAIRIGAARDDQSAHEFTDEQARHYGLFTWHWARALRQARSGDTWRQLFERASLGVQRSHGAAQQPQLAGIEADRPVLGETLTTGPAVMVTSVDAEARSVTLNGGSLAGLTIGSRFAGPRKSPLVRITGRAATWSEGEIESGTATVGTFLTELEHVYPTGPLKLYFAPAASSADRALAENLRDKIKAGTLPGYVLAEDQPQSDLVLALLRPDRTGGQLHYPVGPKGRSALPQETPDADPELWVLTPAEHLLHEHFVCPMADLDKGFARLQRNLSRYRRLREIQSLVAQGSGNEEIELSLVRYLPCEPGTADCREIAERHYRRQPGTQPHRNLGARSWQTGELLSFALANRGRGDRYVYLLDIAADGEIAVIFPARGMRADEARIAAGETLDLDREENIGLLIDHPGEENLLLLATRTAIDPFLLEQQGYEASLTRGGSLNALEQLLTSALQGNTRGRVVGTSSGSWALSTYRFQVVAEGADRASISPPQ